MSRLIENYPSQPAAPLPINGQHLPPRAERIEYTSEPVMVNAASVTPRPVHWLWPGRIALGKLSLLIGDPEVGKSFTTLDIAARVSTGTPWPDTRGAVNSVGNVIILSAEDDVEDTIVPRLIAARADLNRISILECVEDNDSYTGKASRRSFSLADLEPLEKAIQYTPDLRLIIIDPVTAFLGSKTDSHKNADVRAILAPLAELASRYRVAVLAVSHMNKNAAGTAMYRAMGSLAFVAAARAVWCAIKDKDNPARRLFLRVKNNLARDVPGMAYSIVSSPDGPCVAWDAEPVNNTTADEAMAPAPSQNGPEPEAREEAKAFIVDVLGSGPRLAREMITEAREAAGISKPTLDRARKEVGVVAYREAVPGPWFWKLPQGYQEVSDNPRPQQPEYLDNLAESAGKQGFSVVSDPKVIKVIKSPDDWDDDQPPMESYFNIADGVEVA